MAEERVIRLGQVSEIDYEHSMIRVVYNDMDRSVSRYLPYLALDNEYHLPEVEDYVCVLHLTNGTEAGIVLGKYWNKVNVPPAYGPDVFRKDFSNTPDVAYLERDPRPEVLLATLVMDLAFQMTCRSMFQLQAAKDVKLASGTTMTLQDASGAVTVGQIIQHIRSH